MTVTLLRGIVVAGVAAATMSFTPAAPTVARDMTPITLDDAICQQYDCYTFTAAESGESLVVPMAAELDEALAASSTYSEAKDDAQNQRSVAPTLNPITIAQCNLGQSETIISNMPSTKDGLVALRCGNSSVGYIHIREGHEKDWKYFLNQYPIGGTWDDFMLFTARNALAHPDPRLGMPQAAKGNKRCYATPVQIRNPKGVVVDTINPTFIVSSNNRILITAIPTSNTPRCNG